MYISTITGDREPTTGFTHARSLSVTRERLEAGVQEEEKDASSRNSSLGNETGDARGVFAFLYAISFRRGAVSIMFNNESRGQVIRTDEG